MKRFQNKIAESRSLLPFTALYGLAIWILLFVLTEKAPIDQFMNFIISAYFMVELNNRNALLRIYSRMVSSTFIVLMAISPLWLCNKETLVTQFFLIIYLTNIFKTYQQRDMMGHTYAAYLFIGGASFFWQPILYLVPVLWVLNTVALLSFNFKNFMASLLGLLTIFWVLLPFMVFESDTSLVSFFAEGLLPGKSLLAWFEDPIITIDSLLRFGVPALVQFLIYTILTFVSVSHYINKSFEDKIQVRMLYNFFITIGIIMWLAALATILLPFSYEAFQQIMMLLTVCISPLIAHYITFTRTFVTNISVIIALLAIALLTAFNILSMANIAIPFL